MFARYNEVLNKKAGEKTLLDWGNLFMEHMKSIDHLFDPGHKIDHVMRVTHTALKLAIRENADLEIVFPAIILHDTFPVSKFSVNREKASELSAENSIKLLREWSYPPEYLDSIKHAILAHSFSAGIQAETLEAKVVQDADRLDALGCIGMARTMAVGFAHGNPLYLSNHPFPDNRKPNDRTNILDHFYQKLFTLPQTLHTESAKKEAVVRIERIKHFLEGLAEEIDVNYLPYKEYCRQITISKNQHNMYAGTSGTNDADALGEALKAGYRKFDLATAYKTHALLAEAMMRENIKREDVQICTKINDGDLIDHDFSVYAIYIKILEELKTNYIDIFMLHSPALLLHDKAAHVFEDLIHLKKHGRIHEIGVSNFTVEDFNRLDKKYLKHITFNEIEGNPYCQQKETVKFCDENKIAVMFYRPFGKGKADDLLQNETLKQIAGKHHATITQVILAWVMQQNRMVIVRSANAEHLKENMRACELVLDDADMQAISTLDRNLHTCDWEQHVKLTDYKNFKNVTLVKPEKTKVSQIGMYGSGSAEKEPVGYPSAARHRII